MLQDCGIRAGWSAIDYLGEDVTDIDGANATMRAYLQLLTALGRRPDATHDGVRPLEVSLKLSAFGQALDRDGEKIALENAHTICERAELAGAWVTVDAEDHTTTDSTLSIAAELQNDFPGSAWCCRRICDAPTATVNSSPHPGPGYGCAKAPTTNRHRWPTGTPRRSPTRT